MPRADGGRAVTRSESRLCWLCRRGQAGACVRVAQQDRAQDSLLQNWAWRSETAPRIRSKSGKAAAGFGPADPEPSPGPGRGRCRDWTGGTYRLRPSRPGPRVKGQSRPRTVPACRGRRRKPKWDESWGRGFESRRGRHFGTAPASPGRSGLGLAPSPYFSQSARALARSLPRQGLCAPCQYALYWARRAKPLTRQIPSPSLRDPVRNPG